MDRLRKLDAAFAKHVLGCKLAWGFFRESEDLVPGCSCDGHPHANTDARFPNVVESWDTPHYTRSLDAAWEGAGKIPGYKSWSVGYVSAWDDFAADPKLRFTGELWTDNGCDKPDSYSYADHPAEALVLACLRAVGCSEDELA